jgi:hypothetical protein
VKQIAENIDISMPLAQLLTIRRSNGNDYRIAERYLNAAFAAVSNLTLNSRNNIYSSLYLNAACAAIAI